MQKSLSGNISNALGKKSIDRDSYFSSMQNSCMAKAFASPAYRGTNVLSDRVGIDLGSVE